MIDAERYMLMKLSHLHGLTQMCAFRGIWIELPSETSMILVDVVAVVCALRAKHCQCAMSAKIKRHYEYLRASYQHHTEPRWRRRRRRWKTSKQHHTSILTRWFFTLYIYFFFLLNWNTCGAGRNHIWVLEANFCQRRHPVWLKFTIHA